MTLFSREWLVNELAGLEQQLGQLIIGVHQTEGAIQVIQQMIQQLDNGAAQPAAPALTLDEFENLLPEGFRVDPEGPQHVDSIHPGLSGEADE